MRFLMGTIFFFLLTNSAQAASIFFPEHTYKSKRCAELQAAFTAAFTMSLKPHEILVNQNIGKIKVELEITKADLKKVNDDSYRLGTTSFITLACRMKTNTIMSFMITGWKSVPPASISSSGLHRSILSKNLNLKDSKEKNGRILLQATRDVIQTLVGMRAISQKSIRVPPKIQKKNKGTQGSAQVATKKRALLVGTFLPVIDKIILSRHHRGDKRCSAIGNVAAGMLRGMLGKRLLLRKKAHSKAANYKAQRTRSALSQEGVKQNAQAIIFLKCIASPASFIVSLEIARVRLKYDRRKKFSSNLLSFIAPMPLKKKPKSLMLARALKSALEQAQVRGYVTKVSLNEINPVKIGRTFQSHMPVSTKEEARAYAKEMDRKRARKARKRIKRPTPRVMTTKIPARASHITSKEKFQFSAGLGLGGGMFVLGVPSFMGCMDGHIMSKRFRIGASGSFCLGKGFQKSGFDYFFYGGIDVLLLTIPKAWNMELTLTVAFAYYSSELENYAKIGLVPFWTLTGIATILNVRFRPHRFLSFGVKGGWVPGGFEQRTQFAKMTFNGFFGTIYISAM